MLLRRWIVAVVALCAAFGLFALSGCDDPEARTDAIAAKKEVGELKAQVEELKKQNAELAQKINGIHEDLGKQLSDRIDKLTDQVTAKTTDVLERIVAETAKTREAAKSTADTVRADYQKDLDALKTTCAADVQKIRDELKGSADDLRKFMDNQLRELYPYAYQPRRVEPNAPPAPEAK